MLRQVYIYKKKDLLFFRKFGKAIKKENFESILEDLLEESFSGEADAIKTYDYYKYRISYITDSELQLLFLFVTGLTDKSENIETELRKCKREFLSFFDEVIKEESYDQETFQVFDPTVDGIHKNLRPKISLCGFSGVGKTTITRLIRAEEIPMKHIPTITGDIATIKIGKLHFYLWDFAGQEQFSYLWTNFIKGSDAVLLITDSTLENVEKSKFFLELINEQAPDAHSSVIANKQDLDDALPPEEIEDILGLKAYSMIAIDKDNRDKMIKIIADILEMDATISPLLKPLLERDEKIKKAKKALSKNQFQKAADLFEEISDLCLELGDDSVSSEFYKKSRLIQAKIEKAKEKAEEEKAEKEKAEKEKAEKEKVEKEAAEKEKKVSIPKVKPLPRKGPEDVAVKVPEGAIEGTSKPTTAGPPTAGPPTAGPPTAGPPTAGPPTAGPPSEKQRIMSEEEKEQIKQKTIRYVKKVPSIYDEISMNKIMARTGISQTDLEILLEDMIFDGELNAKIQDDLLIFKKQEPIPQQRTQPMVEERMEVPEEENISIQLNPEDFMVKKRPKKVSTVPKEAKSKLKTSSFGQVYNPDKGKGRKGHVAEKPSFLTPKRQVEAQPEYTSQSSRSPAPEESMPRSTPAGPSESQQMDLEGELTDLKIKKAKISKMLLDLDMKELSGEISSEVFEQKKNRMEQMKERLEAQINELKDLL